MKKPQRYRGIKNEIYMLYINFIIYKKFSNLVNFSKKNKKLIKSQSIEFYIILIMRLYTTEKKMSRFFRTIDISFLGWYNT